MLKTFLLICALGQVGPDLGIPPELKPTGQYVALKPKTQAKAITYIGHSGVDGMPADFLADPRWFLLDTRGLKTGRYLFTAVGSLEDVHTRVDFTVIIGDAPPGPPPNPDVDPPNPDVVPSPVAADGFRVMIVEEVNDRPKLPQSQLYVMTGKAVIEYLNGKAEKDANSKPDWHDWDDDFGETEVMAMPAHWQAPYRKAVEYAHNITLNPKLPNGAQPPVIVITNTKARITPEGELRPLPGADDILPYLKKYGDAMPK